MKKYFAFLPAVVLCLGLTGCGVNSDVTIKFDDDGRGDEGAYYRKEDL